MDGFTLAAIIRALLASAGLKATVVIVAVIGFFYVCWKVAQGVGGFLDGIIKRSDENRAQLARDLRVSDDRRAAYERETAAILATITTKLDESISIAKETKQQMHERFNAL